MFFTSPPYPNICCQQEGKVIWQRLCECTTHTVSHSWVAWQTDRQTDTADIGNNSLHLMHSMQPNNSDVCDGVYWCSCLVLTHTLICVLRSPTFLEENRMYFALDFVLYYSSLTDQTSRPMCISFVSCLWICLMRLALIVLNHTFTFGIVSFSLCCTTCTLNFDTCSFLAWLDEFVSM